MTPGPGGNELCGTVALVTGGGRGLGRLLGQALAGMTARGAGRIIENVAAETRLQPAIGGAVPATPDRGSVPWPAR